MSARPELTFDGFGINGPDEYRTRLATFSVRVNSEEVMRADQALAAKYGPLFAAAPDLERALRVMVDTFNVFEADPLQAFAAIEQAKGVLERLPCEVKKAVTR